MDLATVLYEENLALSAFIANLGYDPVKVAAKVPRPVDTKYRDAALAVLSIDRKMPDEMFRTLLLMRQIQCLTP